MALGRIQFVRTTDRNSNFSTIHPFPVDNGIFLNILLSPVFDMASLPHACSYIECEFQRSSKRQKFYIVQYKHHHVYRTAQFGPGIFRSRILRVCLHQIYETLMY